MDQQTLLIIDVLNRTTSTGGQEIKRAEDQLIEYSKAGGYADVLLTILSNERAEGGTRLAASIALKNFVKNNWNPEGPLVVALLDDEDRVRLRDRILTAMFQFTGAYRRQLSQTVCIVGELDFPIKWPNLVQLLASQLDGNDFDRIDAALSTIEQLIKHYRSEMKSVELFNEIKIVLGHAAPQLTRLYTKMLEYVPNEGAQSTLSEGDQQQWLEILLMEVKCYYSLVWQDFPAFFEDHLKIWMDGFIKLLRMRLVDSYSDDNDPSTTDNIKRVICDIFRLFAQRYEEDFTDYMLPAVETIWQLLVDTDHRIRFDSLVNSALGFLSAVSEKERYSYIFNQPGALEAICQNVIIKNLVLRREDREQFEDEPFDYLKRDIEGLDSETRRRGAADLVRALTKHFEERVFGILSTSINEYLADYTRNPTGEWEKKDVVYFLVSALASKTVTARHGATTTSQLINIADFYAQYVRNDLFNIDVNSFPPILIADALNFVVLFRNHLQTDLILEIFGGQQPAALRILTSRCRILHHYVGYAFDKVYTIKRDNAPLISHHNIPVQSYVQTLFNSLQDEWAQKSHYLIKSLLRSLSIMDAQTIENANFYVAHLVQLIETVVKESQSPQFTHMVFECLCVVIKRAFPFIQTAIGNSIMPIIETIIERDLIDFVPYALQIVALLLYQAHGEKQLGRTVENAGRYQDFFPHLLTGRFWHRSANAPALLSIFEAFTRTSIEIVLRPDNINAVMGLYSRLITERSYDEHGFRLATTLLSHYDVNDVLTSRNILMPMLNRMQT